MMRDQFNDVKFTEAIIPVVGPTGNVPFISVVIDTLHFSTLTFAALFGAIGNGTFTVLAEDSPDNANWTTVPAAELLGATAPLRSRSESDLEDRLYRAEPVCPCDHHAGGQFGQHLSIGRLGTDQIDPSASLDTVQLRTQFH
jgi:hypothetical protein